MLPGFLSMSSLIRCLVLAELALAAFYPALMLPLGFPQGFLFFLRSDKVVIHAGRRINAAIRYFFYPK